MLFISLPLESVAYLIYNTLHSGRRRMQIKARSDRKAMGVNILVTGRPGCGKTTLVERVASALGERAGGFTSTEIRGKGGRLGFSIRTLGGSEGVLAHVNHKSRHRVGRYRVNVQDIDGVAVPAIEDAVREGKIVVIDEIARMELFSDAFRRAVSFALDSPCPVLATIQMRRDPFLDGIRERGDVRIVTVTPENRGQLVRELLRELGENGL
jgi:nucleoside-triphosphatase